MLVLTCEHGGNRIPAEYARYFRGARQVLSTHRGYDHGALAVARLLARALSAPLLSSETSRLLVELNRSRHHRQLFSEFTRPCPPEIRERILEDNYDPYRRQVEAMVSNGVQREGKVLHLSIHSFTPQLGNLRRNADIGLLYDPSRQAEKLFCRRLREVAMQHAAYRIRMNYPYRGKADGLTRHLRGLYPDEVYAGIEVEMNQALLKKASGLDRIARCLSLAISDTMTKPD